MLLNCMTCHHLGDLCNSGNHYFLGVGEPCVLYSIYFTLASKTIEELLSRALVPFLIPPDILTPSLVNPQSWNGFSVQCAVVLVCL